MSGVTTDARETSPSQDPGDRAPLLEVRELFARYPVRRGILGALRRTPRMFVHAVDGVSFSVRTGEMLALVGESGCGKTTTAQTILRLVEPVSGSVLLTGRDITHLSQRALQPIRKTMQMIYQDPYESLDPGSASARRLRSRC